jgi:DNA-binding NtrC family response regulator
MVTKQFPLASPAHESPMNDDPHDSDRLRDPLQVLVVDDEDNIRKTLVYCLEEEGHRVVAVSNPADAVSEIRGQSFNLAFLDLRLGQADGLETVVPLVRTLGLGDQVPLSTIEELHIRRVLAEVSSLQEAANILGIDQATLWRKRKSHGI